MLLINDVHEQVRRVSLLVDGIEFSWNVSVVWESDRVGSRSIDFVGYFVQIRYEEADINSGALDEQLGRKWFVSKHASKSEVLQTCLKAALASAEHRTREWFLVDGVRAYGPHTNADDLVAMLKKAESS